jgi:hypothetical protein
MKFLYVFFFLIMISCKITGDEQPRAYVGGKVITSLALDKVQLKLTSNNIIISETLPQSGGSFTLSGPIPGDNFYLKSNVKIKSFTGRSELKLSADSLSIEFPKGVNYEKELELKLIK